MTEFTHITRDGRKAFFVTDKLNDSCYPKGFCVETEAGSAKLVMTSYTEDLHYLFSKRETESDLKPYNPMDDVAVDTPIWVRTSLCKVWLKRHFARYEDGVVITWADGKTSFTTNDIVYWQLWSLTEPKKD